MKRIILLSALIGSFLLAHNTAHAKRQCGIVAHRGFWNCEEAGYAKNSIAALKCAHQAGFWGSEFDVNMTSDGVLLVYHDSDIEGKKIEKHPYSDFTYFRLKNGEPIPTIDMYLEQGKKHPETMLVYEMKRHSCDEVEDKFIELTIQKLKEHDLLDPTRVMFISFSFHICEVMAQKLPGFTVQYLNGDKTPKEVAEKGINGIDYKYKVFFAHKEWVGQAKKKGMSTNSWTVNKENDIKGILNLKVDMITTDHPLETREIMKELKINEVQ